MLRATEDCTTVMARVIDAKLCINILNPLSDMAECPMNLAAIKMEEKVIRSASETVARAMMDRVVPTLIKVCCLRHHCNLEKLSNVPSLELQLEKTVIIVTLFTSEISTKESLVQMCNGCTRLI